MRLLRTAQAAEYLGISPRTLNRWTLSGMIPVVQLPGMNQVRYDQTDLDKFIEDNKSKYKPEYLRI